MKKPSQEDLLGYVLGALDADQQQQVQQVIDQDPDLEDHLLEIKTSLIPLELLENVPAGRPGLARRTCEMLATIQKEELLKNQSTEPALTIEPPIAPSVIPSSPAPTTQATQSSSSVSADLKSGLRMSEATGISMSGGWSLNDVLVLAASIAVLAAILFPALSYTRYRADITACQSNFASLGQAFLTYSDNHNGQFVEIPSDGNLSVAGSFAPMLKDAGLVEDDKIFACAGVKRQTPTVIPTCHQVETSSGSHLVYLQKTMSGDYGYSLGYLQDDEYRAPGKGSASMIIASDRPSNLEGHRSANHRGAGQNCLFKDGHYQYVSGHSFAEDAIFLNDYHLVAPGAHSEDCVIGASHHSPSHFTLSTIN